MDPRRLVRPFYALAGRFGEDYARYRDRVPLWLPRRLPRRPLAAVLAALLGAAALWAAAMIRYFDHWPDRLGIALAALWLAAVVAGWRWLPRRLFPAALIAGVALVRLLWCWQEPRADRDWAGEQARTVRVARDGDELRIDGLRDARHHPGGATRWTSRAYRLDELEGVELLVSPFHPWRGLAHAFLSFAFADGRRLAVSVEARRERGETYGAIAGAFRRFELIYVVGDERDLVALRLLRWKDPVHAYPLRVAPEDARALLLRMLARAEALGERPEFYHSVTNSCVSNLVRHLEELGGVEQPFRWGQVLPGYADGAAVELGLIAAPDGLDALRRATRLRPVAAGLDDGVAWSRAIRGGYERSPKR